MVTIIAGFPGAGKTTLLHHLLNGNHGLRLAVLLDERGTTNIDLQFIGGLEEKFVQFPNGCCCYLLEDNLPEIIETLLQQPVRPDYLLVEALGLECPQEVYDRFQQQVGALIQIDSKVVIIDVEQVRTLPNSCTPLALAQIREADFLILNKIDLIPSFTLAGVKRWLNQIVPGIRTFEASFGRIPLDLLLGIGEYVQLQRLQQAQTNPIPGWAYPFYMPVPSTISAESVQATPLNRWLYQSDQPFNYRALCQVLKSLPPAIFRVKGRVHLVSDRSAQIQIVGRHASLKLNEIRNSSRTRSQIAAIGLIESMERDRFFELLDLCRTPAIQADTESGPLSNQVWIRSREDSSLRGTEP